MLKVDFQEVVVSVPAATVRGPDELVPPLDDQLHRLPIYPAEPSTIIIRNQEDHFDLPQGPHHPGEM